MTAQEQIAQTAITHTADEAARLVRTMLDAALLGPKTGENPRRERPEEAANLRCTMDVPENIKERILQGLVKALREKASMQLRSSTAFSTEDNLLYRAELSKLTPGVVLASVRRAALDLDTGKIVPKDQGALNAVIGLNPPTGQYERTPEPGEGRRALQKLLYAITGDSYSTNRRAKTLMTTATGEGTYIRSAIAKAIAAGDHLREHPSRYRVADEQGVELTFTNLNDKATLVEAKKCVPDLEQESMTIEEEVFHVAVAPTASHNPDRPDQKPTGKCTAIVRGDADIIQEMQATTGMEMFLVEISQTGSYARHSDGPAILRAAAQSANLRTTPDWDGLSHAQRRAAVMAAAQSPDWEENGISSEQSAELAKTVPQLQPRTVPVEDLEWNISNEAGISFHQAKDRQGRRYRIYPGTVNSSLVVSHPPGTAYRFANEHTGFYPSTELAKEGATNYAHRRAVEADLAS